MNEHKFNSYKNKIQILWEGSPDNLSLNIEFIIFSLMFIILGIILLIILINANIFLALIVFLIIICCGLFTLEYMRMNYKNSKYYITNTQIKVIDHLNNIKKNDLNNSNNSNKLINNLIYYKIHYSIFLKIFNHDVRDIFFYFYDRSKKSYSVLAFYKIKDYKRVLNIINSLLVEIKFLNNIKYTKWKHIISKKELKQDLIIKIICIIGYSFLFYAVYMAFFTEPVSDLKLIPYFILNFLFSKYSIIYFICVSFIDLILIKIVYRFYKKVLNGKCILKGDIIYKENDPNKYINLKNVKYFCMTNNPYLLDNLLSIKFYDKKFNEYKFKIHGVKNYEELFNILLLKLYSN